MVLGATHIQILGLTPAVGNLHVSSCWSANFCRHKTENPTSIYNNFGDGEVGQEMATSSVESFRALHSAPIAVSSTSSTTKKRPTPLFSDLNSDETTLLLGLSNGAILSVDPTQISEELLTTANSHNRRHTDLSCLRCSKIDPSIFYTSSNSEGTVFLWDLRAENRKHSQKFTTKSTNLAVGGNSSNAGGIKPILNFDISCGDQLLCAGTELVADDSYLLFWDVRTLQILGAYWESHSDDVTAVKFHPSQTHSLATGSTDGLMNVFDLLQTSEDDALIYSFNTVSSVDLISWPKPKSITKVKPLLCFTHTNEVKIWDVESGDFIKEFGRPEITESMNATSLEAPDSLHLCGCFDTNDGRLGILASTSGENPQLLEFADDVKTLSTKCLFLNQNNSFQTTQYVTKANEWITCDDKGIIQVWSSNLSDEFANMHVRSPPKQGKKKHATARYKPYSRDSH